MNAEWKNQWGLTALRLLAGFLTGTNMVWWAMGKAPILYFAYIAFVIYAVAAMTLFAQTQRWKWSQKELGWAFTPVLIGFVSPTLLVLGWALCRLATI